MTPSLPPKPTPAWADFGQYAGLGLQFAATLVLFGALGWWLDSKFGSKPWCLVAGIFIGNVIASVGIIRSVTRARTERGEIPAAEPKPAAPHLSPPVRQPPKRNGEPEQPVQPPR